jgi:D-glycero-alpha-D-manno-heptose-7-phosphate kinase
MIVVRTPLRISFAGGGSDLPIFYRVHGGAVLSVTIDKYVHTTVHPYSGSGYKVAHVVMNDARRIDDIEHALTRACLRLSRRCDGLYIHSVSDVLPGTGLGSSSAYCVSLLHALLKLDRKVTHPEELARLACRAELDLAGAPIGKQDQYAASYGGCNYIRFRPDDTVEVVPVQCGDSVLSWLEQNLMLFYLGTQRSAAAILKKQAANLRNPADDTVSQRQLRTARLADELRERLENGDPEAVGPILHAAWELKQQFAKGITNPLIKRAYQAARSAGADGGKLLGAGGGGFLLVCCGPDKQSAVRNALKEFEEMPFRFRLSGSAVVYQADNRN